MNKFLRLGMMVGGLAWAAISAQAKSPAPFSEAALVQANTVFAFQLYSALATNGGNLLFSPYCVSSSLALTTAAARGQTAEQLTRVLHLPPTATNLHCLFGDLHSRLLTTQQSDSNQLTLASAFWPQKHYVLKIPFLNLAKTNYQATVTPQDYFQHLEASRQSINQWADEQSAHAFPQFLPKGVLNRTNKLILSNLACLRGTWAQPSTTSLPQPGLFYLDSKQTSSVPFTRWTASFKYLQNSHLQLLVVPCLGERLQLVILLPRKIDGLPQLEKRLSPSELASWLKKATLQPADIALPQLRLQQELNLLPGLRQLGLRDAFNAQLANFAGLDGATHNLFIGQFAQDARLEIGAPRTETAASPASSSSGSPAAASASCPRFQADHPFVFLVQDAPSGSILFWGRLVKPEPTQS